MPKVKGAGRQPRVVKREHYISENDRKYLICSPGERAVKYGSGQRRGLDLKMRTWAKQALKDLILISMCYDEKANKKIFTYPLTAKLIREIINKQGTDIEPDVGRFYQRLIKEIEAIMNSHFDYSSNVRCDIVEEPRMPASMQSPEPFLNYPKEQREEFLSRLQKKES
jgi:hypothetical protein